MPPPPVEGSGTAANETQEVGPSAYARAKAKHIRKKRAAKARVERANRKHFSDDHTDKTGRTRRGTGIGGGLSSSKHRGSRRGVVKKQNPLFIKWLTWFAPAAIKAASLNSKHKSRLRRYEKTKERHRRSDGVVETGQRQASSAEADGGPPMPPTPPSDKDAAEGQGGLFVELLLDSAAKVDSKTPTIPRAVQQLRTDCPSAGTAAADKSVSVIHSEEKKGIDEEEKDQQGLERAQTPSHALVYKALTVHSQIKHTPASHVALSRDMSAFLWRRFLEYVLYTYSQCNDPVAKSIANRHTQMMQMRALHVILPASAPGISSERGDIDAASSDAVADEGKSIRRAASGCNMRARCANGEPFFSETSYERSLVVFESIMALSKEKKELRKTVPAVASVFVGHDQRDASSDFMSHRGEISEWTRRVLVELSGRNDVYVHGEGFGRLEVELFPFAAVFTPAAAVYNSQGGPAQQPRSTRFGAIVDGRVDSDARVKRRRFAQLLSENSLPAVCRARRLLLALMQLDGEVVMLTLHSLMQDGVRIRGKFRLGRPIDIRARELDGGDGAFARTASIFEAARAHRNAKAMKHDNGDESILSFAVELLSQHYEWSIEDVNVVYCPPELLDDASKSVHTQNLWACCSRDARVAFPDRDTLDVATFISSFARVLHGGRDCQLVHVLLDPSNRDAVERAAARGLRVASIESRAYVDDILRRASTEQSHLSYAFELYVYQRGPPRSLPELRTLLERFESKETCARLCADLFGDGAHAEELATLLRMRDRLRGSVSAAYWVRAWSELAGLFANLPEDEREAFSLQKRERLRHFFNGLYYETHTEQGTMEYLRSGRIPLLATKRTVPEFLAVLFQRLRMLEPTNLDWAVPVANHAKSAAGVKDDVVKGVEAVATGVPSGRAENGDAAVDSGAIDPVPAVDAAAAPPAAEEEKAMPVTDKLGAASSALSAVPAVGSVGVENEANEVECDADILSTRILDGGGDGLAVGDVGTVHEAGVSEDAGDELSSSRGRSVSGGRGRGQRVRRFSRSSPSRSRSLSQCSASSCFSASSYCSTCSSSDVSSVCADDAADWQQGAAHIVHTSVRLPPDGDVMMPVESTTVTQDVRLCGRVF